MSEQVMVGVEDAGVRLDRWFKRHYPQLTHALLEKYLRKGDVRVDGKKAKSSDRLAVGQALTHPPMAEMASAPKRPAPPSAAEKLRQYLLFEDARVVVLNKPQGLAVQGGSGIKTSVDSMSRAWAGAALKLVHRIDRDTSGVLVLAKGANVAAKLAGAFGTRDVEKTYFALVHGAPLKNKGTIDHKLKKTDGGERGYETMQVNEEEGAHARTEYRVVEQFGRKFTLVELSPLTGRTHQLRVHMAAIGCPIVGDGKYGDGREIPQQLSQTLHLHAYKLVLPREILGQPYSFEAPLPKHMKESLEALGAHFS